MLFDLSRSRSKACICVNVPTCGLLVSEPDPSCGGGGKGLGTILHSSCPQVGMLT